MSAKFEWHLLGSVQLCETATDVLIEGDVEVPDIAQKEVGVRVRVRVRENNMICNPSKCR